MSALKHHIRMNKYSCQAEEVKSMQSTSGVRERRNTLQKIEPPQI